MKTILITTDFSEASANASFYGTLLAKDMGANIMLLHVNMPQESFNQSSVIMEAVSEMTSADTRLDAMLARMNSHGGGEVVIDTELRTGEFFTEMYHLCEELNPYMVIMGSQGSSDTERFLYGSNSVHAMRNLPFPLLTIPTGCIYTPIKKIALASNFENTIAIPMDMIKKFRTDFNASLDVVHVGKNKGVNPEVVFKSTVMQQQLKASNAKYHFISREDTEAGILEFADENQVNILIVVPKQYGFFDQLFHKSMSKQLLLNSRIPVMVLQEIA